MTRLRPVQRLRVALAEQAVLAAAYAVDDS